MAEGPSLVEKRQIKTNLRLPVFGNEQKKKKTNPTTATRTSQIQPKLENILPNFFLPSVSFSLLSWLCALDQVDEMPRSVVCQPYRPMGVGAEGAFPH